MPTAKVAQLKVAPVPRDEILEEWDGFTNSRTFLGDYSTLKSTIAKQGLLTPPIVWKTEDPEEHTAAYVLIAGYRRMQCLRELVEEVDGIDATYASINCSVYEGTLDGALRLNLLENIEREDLNPADAGDAIVGLMSRMGNQEHVAEELGISQATVSNYLKLGISLCKRGKDALRIGAGQAGGISLKQARKLLEYTLQNKQPDEAKQHQLLDKWLKVGEPSADDPEASEKHSKRERSIRSKGDVENLRNTLMKMEDDACEATHRASLLTFTKWYFCEVDDNDVMIRHEIEVTAPPVEEDSPAINEVKKKRVRAPSIAKEVIAAAAEVVPEKTPRRVSRRLPTKK